MLRSRAIRYTYARVHGEEPHRRMRRVRLTPPCSANDRSGSGSVGITVLLKFRMADETQQEEIPFTPEQLTWLDRLIEARQASSRPSASDPPLPPVPAAPVSLVTAVSEPGKP